MPLPSSPNSISMSDVNTYLGATSTTSRSMNDNRLRQVFGDPSKSAGSNISMSTGRGRFYPAAYAGGGRYLVSDTSDYGRDAYVIFDSIYANGSAWFSCAIDMDVQVLIVGGGAGGDYRYASGGGGGGGGGVQTVNMRLTGGVQYYATIGAGGSGRGTTLAGATGGSSTFNGYTSTGGLPSGYSSGYNYGRGGTPNGANGGNIGGYAGTAGTSSSIRGPSFVFGSGGGGGGTTGGAGGGGGTNSGGSTNQYGGPGTGYGDGGGGGGYYTGSSYYYGGAGASGVIVVRGNFRISGIDAGY